MAVEVTEVVAAVVDMGEAVAAVAMEEAVVEEEAAVAVETEAAITAADPVSSRFFSWKQKNS